MLDSHVSTALRSLKQVLCKEIS